MVTIASAGTVDGDRPATKPTKAIPDASPPPVLNQLGTAAFASSVKEESVNVAQLKLVQQLSSSSEKGIHH